MKPAPGKAVKTSKIKVDEDAKPGLLNAKRKVSKFGKVNVNHTESGQLYDGRDQPPLDEPYAEWGDIAYEKEDPEYVKRDGVRDVVLASVLQY